jgi:acylphosphatase
MPARRFVVSGLVQGVFYRAQAKERADELGLTGFVKNLDDGGVEIFVEGSEDKLKQLEEWCWKGPPKSKVTGVTVTEDQPKNLQSFDVWY